MNPDPRRGLPSASKMARLAECSGSLVMENQVRSSRRFFELPDPAREGGLRIHRYLKVQASGQTETEPLALGNGESATAQMCIELREIALAAWKEKGDAELEDLVEERLWYRRGLLERVFSGQPDYVLIDHTNKRAIIIDYKTGRTEAEEAGDNLQLRTEVVLLKQNYPELEEISASIVEPWVTWDSIRVRYNRDDLRQAENQILAICNQTVWEPEKRVAGPWCKYCPARAHCPEALGYIETIPSFNAEVAIRELPRGEAGSALWEKLKVAEKLIETLQETYEQILEDEPEALPGYILPKQGKPRRIVPYPAKLKESLAEYLTAEEIDGCATYHLTKIEEVLGLKHRISGRDLKQLVASLTQDAVETIFDRPFIRALTKKERKLLPNAVREFV